MSSIKRPRPPFRRSRSTIAVILLVAVALVGAAAFLSLGNLLPAASSTDARALTAPDVVYGDVADSVTVFDDDVPAVTMLDEDLLAALRRAATDAAAEQITFYVTSGWRSPAFQGQLLREAVVTYGSADEAARWVATAETSPHVDGDAVDIGRWDSMTWLSEHGATYGLCQVYANEPWHYELRPDAAVVGCPEMFQDPTHDPRMQR